MKVVDHQRKVWRVSRRWMPWRRRCRYPDVDTALPMTGIDIIDAVIGAVLFVVVVLPMLLWTLVILLEMLLLLLVLPITIVARLLGSPWPVEVRDGWTFAWETTAGDWDESERVIREVAEILRRGDRPWGYYA